MTIKCSFKRALDSQLAILFRFLKIDTEIKGKNLGFDKKTDFIYEIGLFPKSSIQRLSLIRNKIEHEFKKPNIEEMNVFYDLAYAFIIVIEKTISLMNHMSIMQFTLTDTNTNNDYGQFVIGYNQEEISVFIKWRKNNNRHTFSVSFKDDLNTFKNAFSLLLLIQQNYSFHNSEYTINEIKKMVI